jgi:hypothetical protein
MMSDSRSGPGDDMAQPSIESARDTAFKKLAQLAIRGGSTLDEYAERAVAIQQAASTHEIDAIQTAGAAGAPATRRPSWLIPVLARVVRRGQWRLSDHLWVVSVFTVQTLDLGTAQLQAPGSVITTITKRRGPRAAAEPAR